MKDKIKQVIKENLDSIFDITKYLYANPELAYEEKLACAKLSEAFNSYGFTVETGVYNIPTAFTATYNSGKPGPTVALFAEYDALPGVGHGCGHDLICTMALAAAVGLKAVLPEIGGQIKVFGTPAEETSGAKVAMADQGAFTDSTIAMMAHPAPVSEVSGSSLTLIPLQFQYTGKAAHASACPEEGINALDAVIFLFNGINAIRQHVPQGVQFHGYISNGGCAPNVVPDFAEARFYVRARKRSVAEAAVKKVIEIAHGAETMTGAKVKISNFEATYYDLVTNQALCDVFVKNQTDLGDTVRPPAAGNGSLDLGNVSYFVPAVHGWIGFDDPSLILHSREFAARTVTEDGKDLLYRGACSMALTGYDVITSPELQKQIREEFEASI